MGTSLPLLATLGQGYAVGSRETFIKYYFEWFHFHPTAETHKTIFDVL